MHRPPARGGLHPAHVRPLRARRPDPEHVPGRRRTKGCITRPTRRSGSSTRSIATSRRPATARRCGSCCRSCKSIVEHHLQGTRFGIGVDPADGLLRQGAGGLSAHVDGREGGRLGRDAAARQGGGDQRALVQRAVAARRAGCARKATRWRRRSTSAAERARESFNERFWYAEGGYLYDVVDGEQGDDPACRPNQIFAISLDHPVLDEARWRPVLDVVRERLLTPVGLRSLAPGHPDYKAQYYGDLRARDAAYHQGTVWAWLIGPFVDAWLKVYPERHRRRARLPRRASSAHLDEARHRHDQRDLRRRGAVHAARLHRAGVERRRSAARLGEDGAAANQVSAQLATVSSIPASAPSSRDLLAVLRPVAGALRLDRALVVRAAPRRRAPRRWRATSAAGAAAGVAARPAALRGRRRRSAAARGPAAPPNSRASAASSVCSITIWFW